MKIRKEAILLAIAALGLGGCSEDNPWAGNRGQGGIDLKLAASADVEDALPVTRAGVPELYAPDIEDFAISLRNLDTDMVSTWASLEEFNAEAGFDVGSYTLTAYYGNVNDCGFNKPCFIGEANVNVLEGRESSVDVTATLANVMLSIEYTENFSSYFQDYSVTAHTDGHSNVVFSSYENRAGFLTPGNITLQMSVTNPSGKKATIPSAVIPAALAKHHYHVKFDVNADPSGAETISVVFDDTLTQETVKISLTDEIYNAEAPVVAFEGFEVGQPVEALAGNPTPNPVKFEFRCKEGIDKVTMSIAQTAGAPASENPLVGKEMELVSADEALQNAIKDNGISVSGVFKIPDQGGVINLTDFPRYLPEGEFKITVTVTDKMGKNNENKAELIISTQPIHLEVSGGSAVYVYKPTGSKADVEATVKFTYNGSDPMGCISFKNLCQAGIWKDCDLVSINESTSTRSSFQNKEYIAVINVCDVENSPLPMELWFSKKKHSDFTLDIIEPEYSLTADPFATYARFKVVTANADDVATITNGLTLYKDGKAIDRKDVGYDIEKGILTIDGLNPDTDYTIGYSLTKPLKDKAVEIHTEAEAQIPNSDFSEVETTINMTGVQVGGEYTGISFKNPKYHYSTSIVRSMPKGWVSINEKTCWTGATNKNTWFCVPSTYAENGQVVIRSVGFNHNGTTPGVDAHTGRYYNASAPTFADANKIAGELFLGNYSFNGNETRKDGISFVTRPASISFDYSYEPMNNEKAKVEVTVCDAKGNAIASTTANLSGTSGFTNMTLQLNGYSEFGVKAASIKVKFISSTATVPGINIPTDDALNEYKLNNIGNGLQNNTLAANSYHAVATGSVLTIDNVKLNY